jgi:hypothetical protein
LIRESEEFLAGDVLSDKFNGIFGIPKRDASAEDRVGIEFRSEFCEDIVRGEVFVSATRQIQKFMSIDPADYGDTGGVFTELVGECGGKIYACRRVLAVGIDKICDLDAMETEAIDF